MFKSVLQCLSMSSFFKKTAFKIVFLVIYVIFIGVVVFSSSLHYWAGNVFFGKEPALYNVHKAQLLFKLAAYPLVGQAPEFAHYQLSRTYFIVGQFDLAIEEAKKELVLYPNNKRTYYILGLTYGYMNEEEKAIEAFSRFTEAYPTSWAARNDKAWLQFRIGDIAGALETIEPVSEIRNPWIQNTKGTLLLNLGKLDDAQKAFELAAEIVAAMSEEEWGVAYPGNDPRIYATGLSAMRTSIANNLTLIATQNKSISPAD